MKVLLVHNEYGRFSGEETVFYGIEKILKEHGHNVRTFVRRSADLPNGIRGRVVGFASGIWSHAARSAFASELDTFQPDVVQIQNLYPLISSSILGELTRRRIAVTLMCQNYRLFCPTGLMLRNSAPCSLCATGSEWNCVRHNCEGSAGRSIGYALRNRIARPRLLRQVHRFIVLSGFQRDRFVDWGIDASRIHIIPNFVDASNFAASVDQDGPQGSVGYIGRISPEKGIGTLVAAARLCPEIPFDVAGHTSAMPGIERGAPANIRFVGELPHDAVGAFLVRLRFTVVPSVWYEGFPFVVLEAMLHGKPVVASRIGGLSDIIDDGVTGLHVDPGNSVHLADRIRLLWNNPDLVERLGRASREKVLRDYNPKRVHELLVHCFTEARKAAGSTEFQALRN